jgi:hypothetical protein
LWSSLSSRGSKEDINLKEIDMEIAQVTYYTDSKVVLGYITNENKRFYT